MRKRNFLHGLVVIMIIQCCSMISFKVTTPTTTCWIPGVPCRALGALNSPPHLSRTASMRGRSELVRLKDEQEKLKEVKSFPQYYSAMENKMVIVTAVKEDTKCSRSTENCYKYFLSIHKSRLEKTETCYFFWKNSILKTLILLTYRYKQFQSKS